MIAEVARAAATWKVSGSRIATPLAPPSPGSTPMSTPSDDADEHQHQVDRRQGDREAVHQRADVRSMRCVDGVSAAKPRAFERALGQRHQEPDLEHDEEHHRPRRRSRPRSSHQRVLAEAAHEERDEERRGDVDAEPSIDEPRRRRRRHQHRSAPASAGRASTNGSCCRALARSRAAGFTSAAMQHDHADVERESSPPAGRRSPQPRPGAQLSP